MLPSIPNPPCRSIGYGNHRTTRSLSQWESHHTKPRSNIASLSILRWPTRVGRRGVGAHQTFSVPAVSKVQEVRKQHIAILGEYRLRMELHAIGWRVAMRQGHDLAFL